MGYLQRRMRGKVNVKFHRLRNSFFPKAVKKLAMYLLGNGASIDDKIKKDIDKKLDNKIILGAIQACVDGVNYAFADIDSIIFFRATEFVPLLDERTSKVMAGIRFWQIAPEKPIYIELYEVDGITEYESDVIGIRETLAKRPYKQTVQRDKFTTIVLKSENYNVLPVFPLYANELKTSELTTGLKALIDAYDYVLSDLVDGITLIEGVYWIVKNFGGQDTAELLSELQELKATLIDGSDTAADSHIVETPYQAKQMVLDLLDKQMYDMFFLPDSSRNGRAITATEIKSSTQDMDIKADLLEWNITEFIENILQLKGIEMVVEAYKRRTTINDSETIMNISTQLTTGWIDSEVAIMLDPTIPEDAKADLIKRIELNNTGVPPDEV